MRETLLFSVIDQGIGIPKDRQAQVFEVFTQADTSTTRKFGGTGLGLAICKRLVEMMGGEIWVESEESQGSNFSFTSVFKLIDEKRAEAIMKGLSQEDDSNEADNLKDLNILLAEDNIVNQKIAMRMLEKQGWKVDVVDNGQAVVDKIQEDNSYDVVLMDAHMPILDGLEATMLIRKNEEMTGKSYSYYCAYCTCNAGRSKKDV